MLDTEHLGDGSGDRGHGELECCKGDGEQKEIKRRAGVQGRFMRVAAPGGGEPAQGASSYRHVKADQLPIQALAGRDIDVHTYPRLLTMRSDPHLAAMTVCFQL